MIDPTPFWLKFSPLPRLPRLSSHLEVDVAVIGGGLTGTTSAYLLQQAGARVALLDREKFAEADTGHTTAHLTYLTDTRVAELSKNFGQEAARAVLEAGNTAVHQIHEFVETEEIECGFGWVPGYLHAPVWNPKQNEKAKLQMDAEAAQACGFPARFVEKVPFAEQPGVLFPNQAKFHPRKYLGGLLRAFLAGGGEAYQQTAVESIEGQPLELKCGKYSVRAKDVVIATHVPLQGATGTLKAALFQTKLALYTSYAVGAQVPRGQIPEALFWDTHLPYHYLRVDALRNHDYVIFGGEDHKTGQKESPSECFEALERKLRELVPKAKIDHRWSGQVVETNDGLPFIGASAPHQYVATGFAGNGMTFGTLAAMMIRDAIEGKSNPWQELFDVHRKKFRGGTWRYLTENKDYPYFYLRDRWVKPEAKSLRGVPRGEGKIVQLDGERVAAYRDPEGKLHVKSAICPHMGCIVRWNDAEKTWDCPCHGSRFHAEGKVLGGPAETDLAEPKKK